MKFKLSINSKILLYILGTSIIVYIVTIGFISVKFRNISLEDAKRLADSYAKEFATYTEVKLSEYMDATRTIGQTFETYESINEENRRSYFNDILIKVLEENEEYISAWTTWEPNSIDSLDKQYVSKVGSTVLGNYGVLFYKENGKVLIDTSIESDPDEVFAGDFYNLPKEKRHEVIYNPYYYSYSKDGRNEILETSVAVPIYKNSLFLGVVGLDIKLETLKKITDKMKPFKNSYAFILANNGSFVTHQKSIYTGKLIDEIYPELEEKYKLVRSVQNGKSYSFIHDLEGNNNEHYITFEPINVGKSDTPWSMVIVTPLSDIYYMTNKRFYTTIIIALISLLLLAFVARKSAKGITRPLVKVDSLLKKLNRADANSISRIARIYRDEIGDIAKSTHTLISWINHTSEFAASLKEDKLDYEYTVLNESDELGKSLLELRDRLKKAKEDEQNRKSENERRNWTTAGIAKFSEIARGNSDDLEKFSYAVLSNLVKYLDANQGEIFILDNSDLDDVFLELKAAFAFDRKKVVNKKIYAGEGLVGTCLLEQKTRYLTEIPNDYVEITSGLGKANPSNLLIVPLKYENDMFGVLEIASFNVFEQYMIDFVEQVAEIIGTTINRVKIAIQTNHLLEESKFTSEQLAQQEEEMRQNYEELQTTQEELVRTKDMTEKKIKDVVSILDGLNFGVVTTDVSGVIIDYNPSFLEISGYQKGDLDGESLQLVFQTLSIDNLKVGGISNEKLTSNQGEEIEVELFMNKIQKTDQVNYLYTLKKV